MTVDSSIQRISRLTPLGAILALIEARVGAVPRQQSSVAAALGAVLAADVTAAECPPRPIALRDGFAVEAAAIADAGPYAPVALSSVPPRVDTGEAMPGGTDAVLPLDAIAMRGDRAEAIASVAPGEGVLARGGDAAAPTPLRRAGERLRAIDVAVMRAAGIKAIAIRRPRVCIGSAGATNSPSIDAAMTIIDRAIVESGGAAAGGPLMLDGALADDNSDAVIAFGGTGSGRCDDAVQTLARLGRVEAHGIAVSPGETAAFGFVGERPVLLAPGRLDAALAVWLLIGRRLIAKLAGGSVEDAPVMLPLKRKVTSTIGLTELIPVARADGLAQPLGSGYLSLSALARSDGWIVVPADSEGFAAGTQTAVNPWP